MKEVSVVISRAFRVFLIFMLVFIWIRYYEKNLLLTLLFSAIITFLLDLLFNLIINKKNNKNKFKKEEIKLINGYVNYFILNNKDIALDFYKKLFSKNFQVVKKKNFLFLSKNDNVIAFCPVYKFGKLCVDDIIKLYNELPEDINVEKLVFCGNCYDGEVNNFIKTLSVKILLLDKYSAYENIMKKENVFPDKTIELNTTEKHVFKDLINYAFNKKRAKGYVFSALILIFSSLFVRVSIYYLIISSILILLALFSYTNTKFNSISSGDLI